MKSDQQPSPVINIWLCTQGAGWCKHPQCKPPSPAVPPCQHSYASSGVLMPEGYFKITSPPKCQKCGHVAGVPDDTPAVPPVGEATVAGDYMDRSIADFQRACAVHIDEEQRKPSPDTALIALLCDAVRCSRELAERGVQIPLPATPPAAVYAPWIDRLPEETDADIPHDVRRGLMRCATANGRISYWFLCDIYRQGVAQTRQQHAAELEHCREELAQAIAKIVEEQEHARALVHRHAAQLAEKDQQFQDIAVKYLKSQRELADKDVQLAALREELEASQETLRIRLREFTDAHCCHQCGSPLSITPENDARCAECDADEVKFEELKADLAKATAAQQADEARAERYAMEAVDLTTRLMAAEASLAAQQTEIERLTKERDEARTQASLLSTAKQEIIDAQSAEITRLTAERDALKSLLQRAKPVHYQAECHGACLDDEPEKCGTVKLIAEIDAALAKKDQQ
jgi:hypothetical protein